MVPSRRGGQVLKATKLAEVSEVKDKEEEPQCDGRGEDGNTKAEWQPAEIGRSPLPTPLYPPISSGFHLYAFPGAPARVSGTFPRSRTGQSGLIIPTLLSQFPPYYTSPSS